MMTSLAHLAAALLSRTGETVPLPSPVLGEHYREAQRSLAFGAGSFMLWAFVRDICSKLTLRESS
jgi:hypothetical protein